MADYIEGFSHRAGLPARIIAVRMICPADPVGAAGETVRVSTRAAEPGAERFVIGHRLGSDVCDLYADTHRDLDRLLLPRVLERTGGNVQQAALLLGIARQTLRVKLRDLGLAVSRHVEAEEEDAV